MEAPAKTIAVRIQGRDPLACPAGTLVGTLLGQTDPGGLAHLGALVNNEVVTLAYRLEVDSEVVPLTMTHPQGWRIYRSSVSFLLARTMHELFPETHFAVEHSLGSGFYCSFGANGGPGPTAGQLARIEARMREIVALDLPIVRRKVAFGDALKHFEEERQLDKYDLLRFRNPPKIVVYECDGFTDLAHVVLADRTGSLGHFALVRHRPGFVLQLPEPSRAPELGRFRREPQLFRIFAEHKEWGRILGIRTVGDLNRLIAERQMPEIVRIAEAFHEKGIARVADAIARGNGRRHVRWVLIAGPSSSGKTTFSKRLAVQLRVNGLRPVAISVDDYFVDRERTRRDADGALDFEHIETVDLDLFNRHLAELDRGREVELPSFNFEEGRREWRGRKLRLEPDQLAIVEGIHGLNPRLTRAVPPAHKFGVYVSALTQLNLDFHNRIATTDVRLIRRMVRDHQYRGNDALTTLTLWPGVRRGEKRWVFPFQKKADAVFNSALDYELAVLKPLAEPLLKEVKPWHAQYAEARRLMYFLESFLPLTFGPVPPTSILREFIGRSGFRYG